MSASNGQNVDFDALIIFSNSSFVARLKISKLLN